MRSQRTVKKTGLTTSESRFYLSSVPPNHYSPLHWLHLIRGHWGGVEIRNHWRRDALQGEDRSRSRNPNLLANLALLRSALLALLNRNAGDTTAAVMQDQLDRLRALRCYLSTLRNVAGWIAGVHGFMGALAPADQAARRAMVRATIDDEIRNGEELLRLWSTSRKVFMPIAAVGEGWAMYGEKFGSLLQAKIRLMKKHRDDTPHIDPAFMWRPGPECPVPPSAYLRY